MLLCNIILTQQDVQHRDISKVLGFVSANIRLMPSPRRTGRRVRFVQKGQSLIALLHAASMAVFPEKDEKDIKI